LTQQRKSQHSGAKQPPEAVQDHAWILHLPKIYCSSDGFSPG
jgi:hypothetical protein